MFECLINLTGRDKSTLSRASNERVTEDEATLTCVLVSGERRNNLQSETLLQELSGNLAALRLNYAGMFCSDVNNFKCLKWLRGCVATRLHACTVHAKQITNQFCVSFNTTKKKQETRLLSKIFTGWIKTKKRTKCLYGSKDLSRKTNRIEFKYTCTVIY